MAFFKNNLGFDFNSFLGWGLTTLALRFLNKTGESSSEAEPDSLNINETKLGTPIGVAFGRILIKSPLISYFGDFDARAYTEEYSAHANFNAWPLVFALIAQYIASPNTTTSKSTGPDTGGHTLTAPILGKDVAVGPLINSLFLWLLSWLINGRNLKTTIQKGFKYYLGYQQIVCWSHPNARLRGIWMNEKKVWSGDEPAHNHIDGSPFVIKINNEDLFGGPDEEGGFVGEIHVYFGGENQNPDPWMIQQMSADSVQEELRGLTPAYRPYIHVVVPKAYIGKRATIPTMWYEVQINPDSILEVVKEMGIRNFLKGMSTSTLCEDYVADIFGEMVDEDIEAWKESNDSASTEEFKSFAKPFITEKLNELSEDVFQRKKMFDKNKHEISDLEEEETNPKAEEQLISLEEIKGVIETIFECSVGDDCNPSEIFNEIVTNSDWGLAEKYDVQNIASIVMMGKTLREEELGLSVLISDKIQASNITDDICEHINAIRYADESTSTVTYRLIRGDYFEKTIKMYNGETKTIPNTIKEVTESNCGKITFVRQDWSNTISEVSVNFTDRSNIYETCTVTADDISNVEIQNGIKSTKTCDLKYFTNSANALWAAKRIMTANGYPLANVSLELNRFFFDVRLGDVLKLNFKPYGISNMILRVNNVSHADFESGTISVDAIEDVFALSKTIYNYSNPIEWEKDPKYPTGAQYFGFFEMPYEITLAFLTYVYAFCCQPEPDTVSWTVWRKKAGEDFSKTAQMTKWSASGMFIYDYKEDTEAIDYTRVELKNIYGMDDIHDDYVSGIQQGIIAARQGTYILFAGNEIMSFSTISKMSNGNFYLTGVIRGTYDTVPENHASGDEVFFIRSGHYANVTAGGWVCKEGQETTEQYNITTATLDEEEDFDSLKIVTFKTQRRTERPTVQANIKMYAHDVNAMRYVKTIAGDFRMTWSPRDKFFTYGCVSQTDTTDYFSGADIVLPDKCEYVTKVYVGDNCIYEQNGKEAEISMTWLDRCNLCHDLMTDTRVETYTLDTEKSLESLQKQTRSFLWSIPYMVGVADNVEKSIEIIKGMDDNGECYLPHSYYNEYDFIPYTKMPIILIAEKLIDDEDGAVIDKNGDFWKPTGDIVAFLSSNKYYEIEAEDGYVIYNPFRRLNSTNGYYYRWTDGMFEETEVNADGNEHN